MATRVLIALGRQVCRDGLRQALSSWVGVEVVAETSNGHEAVSLAGKLQPNIAVIESNLPGLNGADVTRQIIADCPRIAVVAISMQADWELVTRSLKAGVTAYVLADGGLAELRRAFDAISEGHAYVSPAAEAALYSSLNRLSEDSSANILTPREREVLQLMAEGKPTKEAADILNIGVKTIETHKRQVMKKLGIFTIAGLTKFAVRHHITSLND